MTDPATNAAAITTAKPVDARTDFEDMKSVSGSR
jgi:hypothetical protein